MVDVVLGVIEIDQQGRTLDSEGMRLGKVDRAVPGEVKSLGTTVELLMERIANRLREIG